MENALMVFGVVAVLWLILYRIFNYPGFLLGLGCMLSTGVSFLVHVGVKWQWYIELAKGPSFAMWAVLAVIFAILLHISPAGAFIADFIPEGDTSHGTAAFAKGGLLRKHTSTKTGIALGEAGFLGKKFRVESHILTCAPSGSGKDVGAVIPALLEHPGSVIVLDPKGEDYAVTHRQRSALGSNVYLVDPFGLTDGETARFNWLDFIDVESPDCVSQAALLADYIVVQGEKSDSHFEESAKSLLQGLILLAAADPDPEMRNIASVRQMLTLTGEEFTGLMTACIGHPAAYDVISRCASKMLGTPERERGSIISTAQRHTAFLDDPRIAHVLSGTDFDLRQIKHENMSVFLVFPPDKLRLYRSFNRAFFGLAQSALTASNHIPPAKVLFIFNEFAQLGYMPTVEDGLTVVRGYGGQFWIIVQDLSQLKGVYSKWQTFLANTTRQFFGCSDYDTAKYISDSLGAYTQIVETGERSHSHVARNLLNPDEVLTTPTSCIIVLMQGQAPVLLDRMAYYSDPAYKGLYDANPYYQG